MIRANEEDPVRISVMAEISHPVVGQRPYLVSHDGEVMVVPGVGGITYNKRIGDTCVGLVGDHVEPGVSTKNLNKAKPYAPGYNCAYNALACIGNEAIAVHSSCFRSGHGPVGTTLFTTGDAAAMEVYLDSRANLAAVLGIA